MFYRNQHSDVHFTNFAHGHIRVYGYVYGLFLSFGGGHGFGGIHKVARYIRFLIRDNVYCLGIRLDD